MKRVSPCLPHRAAGDVVAQQPGRQRQQRDAEQARSPGLRPGQQRDQHGDDDGANSRLALRDGGMKRDSSSRSPAIVSTRKAIHQPTTSWTAQPAAHSAVPMVQQPAASAIVSMKPSRWRRSTSSDAASSTPLAASVSHGVAACPPCQGRRRAQAGQQRPGVGPQAGRSPPRARGR